jgi:hypothetical protein
MNLSRQPTFVVFTATEGSPPGPVFAFHAQGIDAARSMLARWARYHGQLPSEFGVEENPNFRECGVSVHDEYVDHYGGSVKTLCFYSLSSPQDDHPTLAECHVVRGKLTEKDVRELLAEVARQQFDGRAYKVWTNVQSPQHPPVFGLAAEDLNVGRFIVPCLRKRTL